MECDVILKDVISFCSICKHNDADTNECNNCMSRYNIDSTVQFPTNFILDKNKIPEILVHDYYELLNRYTKLLDNLGFAVKREEYENE